MLILIRLSTRTRRQFRSSNSRLRMIPRRTFRHRFLLSFMVATVILACPVALWSEPPGHRSNQPERVELSGTIRSIKGKAMEIESIDGNVITIQLPANHAMATYTGTANDSFLKRGQPVAFSRRKGAPENLGISHIQVYDPRRYQSPEPHNRNKLVPGIHHTTMTAMRPLPQGGGVVGNFDHDTQTVELFEVVSTIRGVKKNQIVVAAGATTLEFALNENVKISVSSPE